MTKPIPQIMKYMTQVPLTVERETSLSVAYEMMQENQIRHLPVVSAGKIEGVLSSTDINLIQNLKDVDFDKLKVEDCFSDHPYQVGPETLLDVVLGEMAENKYGCVLVNDNNNLVGIFTWIDALKATKSLLETRLK